MRGASWLVILAVCLGGCTVSDENPDWDPKSEYPSWTYDAPFYYRPTEDLAPLETIGVGIPVYYTRHAYFFVRHPAAYQVSGEPRLAVWHSADDGTDWQRCGFFGVEQTHFLFEAEADGRHWIRFVGPGQGAARMPPGTPHRIYVVDTVQPTIDLHISPAPWDDEKEEVPHIYRVGDEVVLTWSVADSNLEPDTIKLGTCFARFPNNLVWSEFPQVLPARGQITVEVPPEAVRASGMRFRMEARDKPGNIAMALTEILHVTGDGSGAARPVPTEALRQAAHETMTSDRRTGWPSPGAMLRGGTSRVLRWMPESAAKYQRLVLQFTANDGRSWRDLATDFKAGQAVKWTVPELSSKNCRLRIIAVADLAGKDEPGRLMLAMTQRFTVDTVVPDSIIPKQPKPLSIDE